MPKKRTQVVGYQSSGHISGHHSTSTTPVAQPGGTPDVKMFQHDGDDTIHGHEVAMKTSTETEPKQNRTVLHPLPLSSLQQIQRRAFAFILQLSSQTNHEQPHQCPCLEEQISERRPLLEKRNKFMRLRQRKFHMFVVCK